MFLTGRFMLAGEPLTAAGVFVIALTSWFLSLGVSRYLEYRADEFAARYLDDPDQVIEQLRSLREADVEDRASSLSLFENILPKHLRDDLNQLFSTHPTADQRIANIERFKDGNGLSAFPFQIGE